MAGDFKVAFIQDERMPQQGIMSVSAVLKEHGFSTDIFSIVLEKENIVDNILKSKPDLIGCSVMTPGFKTMMEVIYAIKARNPSLFIVMGGHHPTFYPKVIEEKEELDAICIGEGEYAMLELASSLKQGKKNTNIKNMWLRQERGVVKNGVMDLISDLDSLPFPDRDLYFMKYPFLAKEVIKFMIGRGCPFNCSYCFNKGMLDLYKGKGHWLRFKSNKRVIEEIKNVKKKYPMKWLSFVDDTFNANKEKLKELLDMYKSEIGIPFLCQLRIDAADEEQIELLKQAGVERIAVGIEHGNEEFRKKILNRSMTNKQILDFSKWVNKRKVRIHTQNIMGFPGETIEQVFTTIELNAKIKPEFANSNILTPYPGTDIYTYAKNNGYLDGDFNFENIVGHNTSGDSNVRIKSEIKNNDILQIVNLRCFFMLLVWYPWVKPLVKILIKFPYNRFYEFLWQITGNNRITWRYANWKERKMLISKLMGIIISQKK
jgi:anaerobic magnesium-protoporphyrin IX monomethyl ester cyclase